MNVKPLMAVLASSMIFAANPVSANTVEDAWQLNLSVANGLNGYAGLSDATNIDHLNVTGKALVEQEVVGGVALGQSFVDTGYLQFDSYLQESAAISSNFSLGHASALYLTYDGLTGTLNGDGSLSFDPGAGTVKLWLEDDVDADPTTSLGHHGALELAEFAIRNPSGGSGLDFFGGTAANSTVDITLEMVSSIAGLFADENGVQFPTVSFAGLINVDSLLDPNFNPNPDTSGVDQFGNGTALIYVQNGGQFNIPEPGTLAIMGLGLLGLVAARRNSKKHTS